MEVQIILLFINVIVISCTESDYKLKQVVMVSRHGIRSPRSHSLDELTPKPWPAWKVGPGYLTEKGARLEGYMGEFIAAWLNSKGILTKDCPTPEEFYVHANYKERTVTSAKAFTNNGFPGCNITVHYKRTADPVFDPVIHNSTNAFLKEAHKEMSECMASLQLNNSIIDIGAILDYNNSIMCKIDKKCSLFSEANTIHLETGVKPILTGPIKLCHSAVDAFIMEYYERMPNTEVAWGDLTNEEIWRSVMDLHIGYHDIIYNTTLVAKDICEPLLRQITDILLNDNEVPKVTLLMGHDSNIAPLLNVLKVKPYVLEGHFDKTPIGGMIVIQKWGDITSKKDLLRIEYVYQTGRQLREGLKLKLDNRPIFTVLELENCPLDTHGYCSWDDFKRILNSS